MSLNKFTNTLKKEWMAIGCSAINSTSIGCDDIAVTNNITADDIQCNTLECKYLEYEEIKPGLPVQTYFTNQFTQILPTPLTETNVLVNGVGSVAYTGNDKLGSETTVTSLFIGTYATSDTWSFKIKRGGKTILNYQYQTTKNAGPESTSVTWKITCNEEGISGKALVEIRIKRGGTIGGVSTEEDRYRFTNVDDDITATGDLEFTIEPVAVVGALSELQHIQSSVVRRIT